MSTTYAVDDEVIYDGDLPCDDAAHTGTVTAVLDDASGDQIVAAEFSCGLSQYIPSREPRPAAAAYQSRSPSLGAFQTGPRRAMPGSATPPQPATRPRPQWKAGSAATPSTKPSA